MLFEQISLISGKTVKAIAVFGLISFSSIITIAEESPIKEQKAQFIQQSSQAPLSWDMDANGAVDALTDGLLVLRYLFELRGDALVSSAVASDSLLTSTEIAARIETNITIADIDGNGEIDALTDGLLVLRYLFELRNDALIAEAIGAGATRTDPTDIGTYIESYYPGNSSNLSNSELLAVDDSFTTNQGAVVSGNLQTNDTGLVNTAVIYNLTAAAENGTASINNNGTFSYTPASGFNGFDSFTYSVTDALGNESSASVTISVFSSTLISLPSS